MADPSKPPSPAPWPPPPSGDSAPHSGRGSLPPSTGREKNEKFLATVVTEQVYGQTTRTKEPYLTFIAGGDVGLVVKLKGGETTLGRSPDSTITVDSEGVSWRHAKIFQTGPLFLVEDCKSTNGTGVNDRKIDMHQLADGDRIHLGPGVILRFNLYDELEAGMQVQLYESAVKDPLTRAYNRKHFTERLRAEIAFSSRHQTPLSLILFDIDFFKKINDRYGHPGGDQVLREVAAAILAVVRVEDVFARVGGEEFAILARNADSASTVAFAERLRVAFEAQKIEWEGGTIPVTSSFGVATLQELPRPDGDQLVALADKRLYDAKTGGRNRVVGPPT
jgi:two-component system, cell cycle response regulator